MSEFLVTTIAILDERICKIKTINLSFCYEIQRVTKASKIFKTHNRCIYLNKIVVIHKTADTEVKTRDIIGCQLIAVLKFILGYKLIV